ncbi:MAG: HD domain-containing protein [Candidatus Aquicultor sp.]|nr:HD domain-containing protein [Candidatus Aquicultor sp.]
MTQDINSLAGGEHVDACFVVHRKEKKLTKTGSAFADIVLGNKTGTIGAKIWSVPDATYDCFDVGSIVKVTGVVELYQQKPQLKISSLEPVVDGEIDYSDFIPTTSADTDALRAELLEIVGSIKNPQLRKLLQEIFDDGILAEFAKAPAAKGFHHAYLGGLLEHSVGVARLSDRIAGLYPGKVNRDLLVAGALVHDIGKLREFSYAQLIDYSTVGRLIGHHVLGYEIINERAGRLGDIDAEIVLQLGHLILSHHGSYENQSPRKPKTIEALLLHLCDDADAKINAFLLIDEKSDAGAEWSPYNKVLERFIYLRKIDDGD